ncbi:uncharacterized protein TM35_000921100 [Trypanosoma theileri]|uniref:Mucin-associated surface protein (MASP) n=1 Tax=Trypanosoma theileri TaxID=67003 RepID=A0A1X0NEH5_9TRYP|nr:uncharacterized protein TM35_000921100 [Trypanosoma theileri]ORC82366.1 hypothetical protein TM35_000921100 [Trypanosoma theileri]
MNRVLFFLLFVLSAACVGAVAGVETLEQPHGDLVHGQSTTIDNSLGEGLGGAGTRGGLEEREQLGANRVRSGHSEGDSEGEEGPPSSPPLDSDGDVCRNTGKGGSKCENNREVSEDSHADSADPPGMEHCTKKDGESEANCLEASVTLCSQPKVPKEPAPTSPKEPAPTLPTSTAKGPQEGLGPSSGQADSGAIVNRTGGGSNGGSSSDRPDAPAPPAASSSSSAEESAAPTEGDSQAGVSGSSAPGEGAADNANAEETQPSSSSSSSSETVSANNSDTANAGNGTTSPEGEPQSNSSNVENTDTTPSITTTTTTTTTTTLPPELTNNKKGDADSSSSISSSVWVRVPLLIVVTLACILVC